MPRNNFGKKKKLKEKTSFESIISKVHTDFGNLVRKSYFYRFAEPSMTSSVLVSEEKHTLLESGEGTQAL
jgi:hypothetical protein